MSIAPDQIRLAAYEARDHGVPVIHLRAILEGGGHGLDLDGRRRGLDRGWQFSCPFSVAVARLSLDSLTDVLL